MDLYRYRPTPWRIGNESSTVDMTPFPENEIIGVTGKGDYQQMTRLDLQKCITIRQYHICGHARLFLDRSLPSCTMDLYWKDINSAMKTCEFHFTESIDKITIIGDNRYHIMSTGKNFLASRCKDQIHGDSRIVKGSFIATVADHCYLSLGHYSVYRLPLDIHPDALRVKWFSDEIDHELLDTAMAWLKSSNTSSVNMNQLKLMRLSKDFNKQIEETMKELERSSDLADEDMWSRVGTWLFRFAVAIIIIAGIVGLFYLHFLKHKFCPDFITKHILRRRPRVTFDGSWDRNGEDTLGDVPLKDIYYIPPKDFNAPDGRCGLPAPKVSEDPWRRSDSLRHHSKRLGQDRAARKSSSNSTPPPDFDTIEMI